VKKAPVHEAGSHEAAVDRAYRVPPSYCVQ
jgi:hypothetical protein